MYGEKLKDLREEKDLKQYELAETLGIYKGLYNQYEKEYEIIPIKHLNTLSNYYDVSFDYIFGFTNERQYGDSIDCIMPNVVGKRLKEFRKVHNLTQEKLAEGLNIARSALANYERGRNIIATPFLYTICKKYRISADYLLGKTNEIINLN